jgi:heme oxygenase
MSLTLEISANCIDELLHLETSALHRQLESRMGVVRTDLTLHHYRGILEKLYQLYVPLEAALAQVLEHEQPGYYPTQARVPDLVRDLRYLGVDASTIAPRSDAPPIANLPDALGALYVIESSSLNGRAISPHLAMNLGIRPETGGAFFWGYGEFAGEMWRSYLTMLERRSTEANTPSIVQAAQNLFHHLLATEWKS